MVSYKFSFREYATRKATRKNYDTQKPHSDCHSHLDSMLQPTVPSADLEGFTRTYHFFVPSKTTHTPKRRWSWPQRPAATPALQFRNLEPSFFLHFVPGAVYRTCSRNIWNSEGKPTTIQRFKQPNHDLTALGPRGFNVDACKVFLLCL